MIDINLVTNKTDTVTAAIRNCGCCFVRSFAHFSNRHVLADGDALRNPQLRIAAAVSAHIFSLYW